MTASPSTLNRYGKFGFRALFVILLGIVAYRAIGPETSGPNVGSVAKDFRLPVADGKRSNISLEQLRGQPLVIEVFAEWCSACKTMAPRLGDLARANRKSPVRFLGVAVDGSEPELRELKRQWNIPYDVALGDSQFSSDYAISVLPTVIVLDADGKVRHVTTGVTSSSRIDGWLSDLGAARL